MPERTAVEMCRVPVRGPLDLVQAGVLAAVLKGLGNPSRLRILAMLHMAPATKAQLQLALRLGPDTLNHHVQVLERVGLIHFTTDGVLTLREEHLDRVGWLIVGHTPRDHSPDVAQER